MNPKNGSKNQKPLLKNPLEAIREAGTQASQAFSEELVKPLAKDFTRQIFNRPRNFSGEIQMGESLEMKEVYSGKREHEEKAQQQMVLERRLLEEEKVLVERRTNELRIQIQAIHEEIVKLAKATPELSREVEIAAIQSPSTPSTYELKFLEEIFRFIKSFRERIEQAGTWLSAVNRRANRKNMWGQRYKQYGAKYLLSGEHFSQRSAG